MRNRYDRYRMQHAAVLVPQSQSSTLACQRALSDGISILSELSSCMTRMSASYIPPPTTTVSGNRTQSLHLLRLCTKCTTYSYPESSAALEAFGAYTGALIVVSGRRLQGCIQCLLSEHLSYTSHRPSPVTG
ncbi:hypothetical protein CY34DRAFT_540042 [Suillus luteus UH-Slu-Lm8-n1]|uniref:Uncharacterized protein n=1 Tax=Suillus luteus UH-Slu-Lm8-n1 TaxID=930992 RepID=A0A0D0B630_9AGAM|nr:hypothetical protein CY34DRAFT_540042 [Suillus luteus UH-Slu-Lm8-n1]